jgi:hypothetical protein
VALRWPWADPPPCGRVVSRRDDQLLVRVDARPDLHRLLRVLERPGATLVSVSPARRSLEEVLLREVRGGAGPAAAAEPDASGEEEVRHAG